MIGVNLTINELAYIVNELRNQDEPDAIPYEIQRYGFGGTDTLHGIAVKLSKVLIELGAD